MKQTQCLEFRVYAANGDSFHEPDLGAPASSRRVSKREKPTPTRRQDAGAPGFMVPLHAKKRKEAPHEPRSSRREEAHFNLGEESQSLLTSAATVQGFNMGMPSGNSLP